MSFTSDAFYSAPAFVCRNVCVFVADDDFTMFSMHVLSRLCMISVLSYASDHITHDLARSTDANTELNGFHATAVTAAALRTNKPPGLSGWENNFLRLRQTNYEYLCKIFFSVLVFDTLSIGSRHKRNSFIEEEGNKWKYFNEMWKTLCLFCPWCSNWKFIF